MHIFSLGQAKTNSERRYVISTFVVLELLLTTPLVFAQDSGSIETLRQTGKAFAKIAEKASPAVVWITAEKTITKSHPSIQQRPFGKEFDPFEDDFFDFFFRRGEPRKSRPPQKYHQTSQGSGFVISLLSFSYGSGRAGFS